MKRFIEKFSNPTDFTLFTMEPLIGSGMFTLESSLVFPLIDRMFGGNGKPLENIRNEFTILELRMMEKIANERDRKDFQEGPGRVEVS